MKSADFLDAVRAKHGFTSDYQVHKFLRIAQSRVSMYRTGRREFDSKTCHLVANALDVDPAWVMVEIQVERANRTEDRDAWQRVADLVKVAGVASVLALAVFLEVDAPTLENAGVGVLCILCYIACAAAWRHFRPTRRTDTKHRTLSGRRATAQDVENRSHFTISLAAGREARNAKRVAGLRQRSRNYSRQWDNFHTC